MVLARDSQRGEGLQLQFSTSSSSIASVDEILSKGLSDSVATLFSASLPLPLSNLTYSFVSQVAQPVALPSAALPDDDAGFASATSQASIQTVSPPMSVVDRGNMFFEAAVNRLGLSLSQLGRLVERDEEIRSRFGSDLLELIRLKKSIKNELKEYDIQFKTETGREPARIDKEPMRLLYTLYRKLRDMISVVESAGGGIVAPQVVSPEDEEKIAQENRLNELLQEKQQVRLVLQEYQSRFLQEQGRRIKYHRDIVAVDREYRQYKTLKDEIGKIETLLGRPSTASFRSGNDLF